MARKRKPGDDLYNARRRVKRLAERYEKHGDTQMATVLKGYVSRSYKGGDVTAELLNRAYQAGQKQQPKSQPQLNTAAQTTAPASIPTERTPRPKKASDDLYNARRRLRRQADKLERDAQKAQGAIAEQMRSFARELRKSAQAGKKLDERQRSAELDRLQTIRDRTQAVVYGKFSESFRRNLILQQQLNAAGVKGADSTLSEREKDIFWMSVKGLWTTGEKIPRNERYNRILQAFYLSPGTSTQKEFEAWLKKKGINIEEVAGDLSLVFEFVTQEKNKPEIYDQPETDYEFRKKNVRIVK